MSLDVELLNCRRMTVGMFFPARQFQPAEMNRLYATVTDSHPYQSLQHLPDGIRMANQENDCILQGGMPPNPGRIQINENNMFHFQPAKEKALDIFEIISNSLAVSQFLAFGVKLTAFLPTEPGQAGQVLENSLFAGMAPILNQLGSGRQGTGLRVVLNNNGTHDLRIEPLFSDMSQLYIELDVQYPEPFNGLEAIENKMEHAYHYMVNDVSNLLKNLP